MTFSITGLLSSLNRYRSLILSRCAKIHTVENELVLFGSSCQCQMGSTRTLIQFRFLYELQVHFTKAGNEGIV